MHAGDGWLAWPPERAGALAKQALPDWFAPGSNLCLDFHGDPAGAELCVLSDGNHHMALLECLDRFARQGGGLRVFYATTPPGPIRAMLRGGGLALGNLIIRTTPHVFISPADILDGLVAEGFMDGREAFVKNRGNVILVKKGNPKGITRVTDLARPDVTLFLSNPETEKASYRAYHETLCALGGPDFVDRLRARGGVVFGHRIHHREAPQAVAPGPEGGEADAAMVFYHLALRYIRIFPELFEIVPLGGTAAEPQPLPGNVVGVTHKGLVDGGGKWGQAFADYLLTKEALSVYRGHGLLPVA